MFRWAFRSVVVLVGLGLMTANGMGQTPIQVPFANPGSRTFSQTDVAAALAAAAGNPIRFRQDADKDVPVDFSRNRDYTIGLVGPGITSVGVGVSQAPGEKDVYVLSPGARSPEKLKPNEKTDIGLGGNGRLELKNSDNGELTFRFTMVANNAGGPPNGVNPNPAVVTWSNPGKRTLLLTVETNDAVLKAQGATGTAIANYLQARLKATVSPENIKLIRNGPNVCVTCELKPNATFEMTLERDARNGPTAFYRYFVEVSDPKKFRGTQQLGDRQEVAPGTGIKDGQVIPLDN